MALSAAYEESARLSRTFLAPPDAAASAVRLNYVTSSSDPLAGIRLQQAESIDASTHYADAALALNNGSISI